MSPFGKRKNIEKVLEKEVASAIAGRNARIKSLEQLDMIDVSGKIEKCREVVSHLERFRNGCTIKGIYRVPCSPERFEVEGVLVPTHQSFICGNQVTVKVEGKILVLFFEDISEVRA